MNHGGQRQSGKPKRATSKKVSSFAPKEVQFEVFNTSNPDFADLGLGPNIVRVLAELGADMPFQIQSATIPEIIRGNNILGRARTGSGKTIAFAAGMVERLLRLKTQGLFKTDPQAKKPAGRGEREARSGRAMARNPKALIIAPTRELALQIDSTVQPLARAVGFYTTQIVGGMPQIAQEHALSRGVDIVIGTPGRIEALVRQGVLQLHEVVVTVVDEADHMCDLGFFDSVQNIMGLTNKRGQVLLYSATLDEDVDLLVQEFLPDNKKINTEQDEVSYSKHAVGIVMREDKLEVLKEILRGQKRALVFVRTRVFAETLAAHLASAGIKTLALHGDLNQQRRSRNLAEFAAHRARVLVATDVAARGIHIDEIDLVLQADPPEDLKTYLHRAGRTGRAGEGGVVLTIIPRTRQKRTRELLESAGIKADYFADLTKQNAKRVLDQLKV